MHAARHFVLAAAQGMSPPNTFVLPASSHQHATIAHHASGGSVRSTLVALPSHLKLSETL
jgi:hypothetical protein